MLACYQLNTVAICREEVVLY